MTEEIAVLSMYCDYREHGEQSLLNLLGSLWKQLVSKNGLSKAIVDSYRMHIKEQSRPTIEQLTAYLLKELDKVQLGCASMIVGG